MPNGHTPEEKSIIENEWEKYNPGNDKNHEEYYHLSVLTFKWLAQSNRELISAVKQNSKTIKKIENYWTAGRLVIVFSAGVIGSAGGIMTIIYMFLKLTGQL